MWTDLDCGTVIATRESPKREGDERMGFAKGFFLDKTTEIK